MVRARERRLRPELGSRGFTLVELLIAVAVLGVLVAVAIPMFSRTTRRAKGAAEAAAMFQDLRTRMDQFQQENGIYPPTIGEATVHPTTPGRLKQALFPLPAAWIALRMRISGSSEVYCGYTWATGLANAGDNIGAIASGSFGFAAPATNWYYLLARCNLDGAGGSSYYFSSSVDPTIRKLNEGD